MQVWLRTVFISEPGKGQLSAYRETTPWYPLNRRLGGPHSRSGRFEEEKSLLVLLEIEPRIVCPFAQFSCQLYRTGDRATRHYRTIRVLAGLLAAASPSTHRCYTIPKCRDTQITRTAQQTTTMNISAVLTTCLQRTCPVLHGTVLTTCLQHTCPVLHGTQLHSLCFTS